MPRTNARGFGLVELLMVVAIIGVLTAISVPSLLRARSSANEAAAVASLRTIHGAQRAFAASCGDGLFAPSLMALGAPIDSRGTVFLAADLAQPAPVVKSGYEIALSGEAPEETPSADSCSHQNGGPAAGELLAGYVLTAMAEDALTGSKDYWSNTGGALFEKPRGGKFSSTNVIGWPHADPQARPVQSSAGSGDVGGLPTSR